MTAGMGNYSFVVFVVINLIGFLFCTFFMPETTGKDLDEPTQKKVADVEDEGSTGSSHNDKTEHIEL
jgi:hypothetical protein